jgi:hypothetical protein
MVVQKNDAKLLHQHLQQSVEPTRISAEPDTPKDLFANDQRPDMFAQVDNAFIGLDPRLNS